MIRFKRLSQKELELLEKEFIKFLASQSITADDWVKIKISDTEQAESLIDGFSNVVYGSVMRSAKFLELRTPKALYCYECHEDHFSLAVFEISEDSDFDLTKHQLSEIDDMDAVKPSIYTGTKPYEQQREDEIFSMMQQGCEITEGKLMQVLRNIIESSDR